MDLFRPTFRFPKTFYLPFFVVPLLFFISCNPAKPNLPNYGKIPSFQLTNEQGQSVSLEDYQGKVWVANFIFTSCAGTCPMLTQRMKRIQDAIEHFEKEGNPPLLKIVSFSVDPERDSPELLSKYSKRFGANPTYWTFLTGPLDQVSQMVVKGFKISMGKVPLTQNSKVISEGEIFEVVHGEKFVLVDQEGQIRGYYNSDSSGLKKLVADMKYLLKKVS